MPLDRALQLISLPWLTVHWPKNSCCLLLKRNVLSVCLCGQVLAQFFFFFCTVLSVAILSKIINICCLLSVTLRQRLTLTFSLFARVNKHDANHTDNAILMTT